MQDSPRASAPHALAAIPCCLSSQSGAVAGGMQLTAGRAGEGTELRRGARHAHAWYAAISERVDAQGRGCATEGLAGRAFCTAGGSKIKGHFGWRWWWWLTHWHILARPFGPSLPQAPPSLLQTKGAAHRMPTVLSDLQHVSWFMHFPSQSIWPEGQAAGVRGVECSVSGPIRQVYNWVHEVGPEPSSQHSKPRRFSLAPGAATAPSGP